MGAHSLFTQELHLRLICCDCAYILVFWNLTCGFHVKFNDFGLTLSLWAFLGTTGPDPDPDSLIWLLDLMSELPHCYGLVCWCGILAESGYHHRPSLLFFFGCCGTLPLPERPVRMPCRLLFSLTEQPTLACPWTQQLISISWNTKCLLDRLQHSHTENMKQNC